VGGKAGLTLYFTILLYFNKLPIIIVTLESYALHDPKSECFNHNLRIALENEIALLICKLIYSQKIFQHHGRIQCEFLRWCHSNWTGQDLGQRLLVDFTKRL